MHVNAPEFLLYFHTNTRSEKLVVRVNYRVKKAGGGQHCRHWPKS